MRLVLVLPAAILMETPNDHELATEGSTWLSRSARGGVLSGGAPAGPRRLEGRGNRGADTSVCDPRERQGKGQISHADQPPGRWQRGHVQRGLGPRELRRVQLSILIARLGI